MNLFIAALVARLDGGCWGSATRFQVDSSVGNGVALLASPAQPPYTWQCEGWGGRSTEFTSTAP